MNPQNYSTESVFWTALEIRDQRQREQYLDEACGNDAKLRTQVERMIVAHP